MIPYRNGETAITREEMESIHIQGTKYNFGGLAKKDLTNVDFSRMNLSGSDFSYLDLQSSTFNGAHLEGCLFMGSYMYGVNFQNANLISANFEGACLNSANFGGANMREAVMAGADLDEAKLSRVNTLREAFMWSDVARGNGHEVTALQLGDKQVTFVLDHVFAQFQSRPVHEFISMSDTQVLESMGGSWLEWWKQYNSVLVAFMEAQKGNSDE